MSFLWNKEDEERLKTLSSDKSLTAVKIGELLGRTGDSVTGKLNRLGINRANLFTWSSEEDERLRVLARNMSLTRHDMASILNRTERSIAARLNKIGIRRGFASAWTPSELEILKSEWMQKAPSEIADILNRTISAVKYKAYIIGLSSYGRRIKTIQCIVCSDEIETTSNNRKFCLKCYYAVKTNKRRPPGTPRKVREDTWPQERIDKLLSLRSEGKSASIIATILGVTRNSVSGKINRLGLCSRSTTESRAANGSRGGKATRKRRPARIKIAKPPKQYTSKPKVRLIVNGNVPGLVPLEHEPIHLVQTKNGQCRFIEGDDRMCCGRKTLNGFSWCPHHYVRAHVDRRSASVAGVNQQSLAHRTGQEHPKQEIQTLDRGSPASAGQAGSEASNW